MQNQHITFMAEHGKEPALTGFAPLPLLEEGHDLCGGFLAGICRERFPSWPTQAKHLVQRVPTFKAQRHRRNRDIFGYVSVMVSSGLFLFHQGLSSSGNR